MDSNVGGAVVPSLGSVSISGGYSSGWGNSYSQNNDAFKVEIETIEAYNFDKYEYTGAGVDKAKFAEGVKPVPLSKFQTIFATEPIKNFFKDISSYGPKWWQGGFGVFTTFASGILTDLVSNSITKKSVSFNDIVFNQFGKATSGTINFVLGAFSIKKIDGKFKWTEKGFDKFVINKVYNEGAVIKTAWDVLKNKTTEYQMLVDLKIDPYKPVSPKTLVTMMKNKGSFSQFATARKTLYNSFLKEAFGSGTGQAIKALAAQMGCVVVFDYAISLLTNVASALWNGTSLEDVFDISNMHYGSELLKSVNKVVFSFAGRFIGYACGCPKLGEVLGAVVGSIVNQFICAPFTDEFGNVDEGWCAIAAGAELAGASVIGVLAGIAAVSMGLGPVGWIVAAGIIAGAAIGYGLTLLAKTIVDNWDNITGWFSNTAEAIANAGAAALEGAVNFAVCLWEDFTIWGTGAIDAVGSFCCEAYEWAVNGWNDLLDIGEAFVGDLVAGAVSLWEGFTEWGSGAIEAAGDFFCETGEMISDFFTDAGDWFITAWDYATGWISYAFA